MDHKNLVIKSKSSNTAITTKPSFDGPTSGKKSWSSARFGNTTSKKRGMYVERKSTNMVFPPKAEGSSDAPKTTKRSRRRDKTFLNRCLSILSQDTKETQFPEGDSPLSKKKPRKASAETVDKGIQDLDAIYSGSNSPVRQRRPPRSPRQPREPPAPAPPPKQRKPRFRSKALKENFNDKLLVLQTNKAPRSPSLSSHWTASKTMVQSRQKLERAIRPETLPPSQELQVKVEENYDQDYTKPVIKTESKVKKILRIEDKDSKDVIERVSSETPVKTETKEHRNIYLTEDEKEPDVIKSSMTTESKKAKKVKIEEPNTLVGDYNEKNKSLYNLFVDLLETTFNVYNVDTEYKQNPASPTFEIDEKVAQKLKTREPLYIDQTNTTTKTYTTPNTQEMPKPIYYANDDNVTDRIKVYQARPNCCNWNPPAVKPKKSPYRIDFRYPNKKSYKSDEIDYRTNLKSQSFQYAQQLKIEAASKPDAVKPKKNNTYKKYRKQTLLDMLKEELMLEPDYFDEPESFHQALAFIARDKKRTRKALRFDEEFGIPDRKSNGGKSGCFKQRKVISSSTKSPKNFKMRNTVPKKSIKTSALPRKFSMTVFAEGAQAKKDEIYSSEPSYHSIEVKAYDYEPSQYISRVDSSKPLIYACSSGISLKSETIMSSKEYMECLEACDKTLSPNSSAMRASTTISQLLLRDVYTLY